MSLKFLNYYELEQSPDLSQAQKDIVQSMLCEKFIKMNNNPALNAELITKNINIINVNTNFYKSKDFITFKFFIDFFDITFELSVTAYFTNTGRYTEWHSYYTGSLRYPQLMNILNINHFDDGKSYLEFSLKNDNENEVYAIIKSDNIRTPLYPQKRTTLKYYFNKYHTVHCKSVETKDSKSTCTSSYSIEGFEKVESEILFLKFLQHIMAERENVDAEFIDYSVFDFEDNYWTKKAHQMFFRTLIGDKRVAFLDYMKIVDMMTI